MTEPSKPAMVLVEVRFVDPDDYADPQAKVQVRACNVPPSKFWTFLNRYGVDGD